MLIWLLSESMMNRARINSTQSIFLEYITRRQVISPVDKFHHVLGRGFMIQRVTLMIFIKCLSATQNQYFKWKNNINKYVYKETIYKHGGGWGIRPLPLLRPYTKLLSCKFVHAYYTLLQHFLDHLFTIRR